MDAEQPNEERQARRLQAIVAKIVCIVLAAVAIWNVVAYLWQSVQNSNADRIL